MWSGKSLQIIYYVRRFMPTKLPQLHTKFISRDFLELRRTLPSWIDFKRIFIEIDFESNSAPRFWIKMKPGVSASKSEEWTCEISIFPYKFIEIRWFLGTVRLCTFHCQLFQSTTAHIMSISCAHFLSAPLFSGPQTPFSTDLLASSSSIQIYKL